MKDIKVPSWVYRNIENYGNCALGYQFNEYTIKELEQLFKNCIIKKAQYCTTAECGTSHSRYKDYYVVWTKEAFRKYAYRTR